MIEGIYACCAGTLEVAIQFSFLGKLAGRKAAPLKVLCFVIFGCIVAGLPALAALKVFFFLAVLVAGGVVIWKTDCKRAVLHGVVTVEVMQLCFGVVNSVSNMLAPYLYPLAPAVLGRVFMVGGTACALGLSCLCYAAICKCIGQEADDGKQSLLTVLVPLLMVLIASGYIDHAIYGNAVTIDGNACADFFGDGRLLLVQAAGIISVLCMMYAYRRLAACASLDARMDILARRARFQEQYAAQARAHYDSTKALRHDMKNHLLVIGGLLNKGNVERAQAYIGTLDETAAYMAFPFQSGSPALDVLLENKFASAKRKGIVLEGFLKLPGLCPADEVDLVTILANALDNAIAACEKLPVGVERVIRISSHAQGEIFRLAIENSFCPACHGASKRGGRRIRPGTGLSNIKAAAGRHGGTVEIGITDHRFCLNVMLLISQQPACISQQIH